jgi:predicted DsbA family dithiol-disulfide isomerase
MTVAHEPLRIDVWSDVVCPWCAIGKANLDRALQGFAGAGRVQITWHSFELDPNAAAVRAGDYGEALARKYGVPLAQARQMIERMSATGAAAGVEMRFDRVRPGNTFDAHRVLHLAGARGVQAQVKERFLRGYLSEGAAIGLPEEVERLAVAAGLDPDEVAEVLASDDFAAEVRADEVDARRLGVTGVPFFVFDGRYAVGGAQPPEVLLEVLQRCWQEHTSGVEVLAVADEVCGPDGCAGGPV